MKLFQTPFFYARTPKMTLLLSLLSDPSIIDRKNHTVLESCIKLVVISPTLLTGLVKQVGIVDELCYPYSISGIIPPVLKLFFLPGCRQTTKNSAKRPFCWSTTLCKSGPQLINSSTNIDVSYKRIFLKKSDTQEGNKSTRTDETEVSGSSNPMLCD